MEENISKIKCKICNKEFQDREALAMHNSAKHNILLNNTSKKKFKIKKRHIILGVIIILSALLVYIEYKKQAFPGEYDNFAKCLTENNATMYGTEWCTHCKAQKALFGKSFQHVNYVDCDRAKDICLQNGVTGYPTWIIGNESYPGTQSLKTLSDLTKCELNKDD